jgi:hypothetical protein
VNFRLCRLLARTSNLTASTCRRSCLKRSVYDLVRGSCRIWCEKNSDGTGFLSNTWPVRRHNARKVTIGGASGDRVGSMGRPLAG